MLTRRNAWPGHEIRRWPSALLRIQVAPQVDASACQEFMAHGDFFTHLYDRNFPTYRGIWKGIMDAMHGMALRSCIVVVRGYFVAVASSIIVACGHLGVKPTSTMFPGASLDFAGVSPHDRQGAPSRLEGGQLIVRRAPVNRPADGSLQGWDDSSMRYPFGDRGDHAFSRSRCRIGIASRTIRLRTSVGPRTPGRSARAPEVWEARLA
jgi:hypothetical protein